MAFFVFILIMTFIGMFIGVRMIKQGAAKAGAAGNTRDRAETAATDEALAAIERWAQANGYRRTVDTAELKRYEKQKSALNAQPTFLDVVLQEGTMRLESYVEATNFSGKALGEMALGAPGIILALPRKAAKKVHNSLREELGLPPIG